MPPRVVSINSASRRTYGWGTKIFAALCYMALAYGGFSLLNIQPGVGLRTLLNMMFLVMMLYWIFIHQQVHKTSYFKQNRWLLIVIGICLIILNLQIAVLFALLALLYWALVVRVGGTAGYFLKYHLLTVQALGVIVLLAGCIALAVIELVMACLQPLPVGEIMAWLAITPNLLNYAVMALLIFPSIALAIAALMDKTPRVPPITDWIRYWA